MQESLSNMFNDLLSRISSHFFNLTDFLTHSVNNIKHPECIVSYASYRLLVAFPIYNNLVSAGYCFKFSHPDFH